MPNAQSTTETIEKTVSAVAAYDYGQSSAALRALEKLVRESHGGADARAAIERELAKLLTSAGTLAGKQFACRMLAQIGGELSVPALAALLEDEKTAEMACYALFGNRSEAAGKALRDALDTARGTTLVAVVMCLAERRDRRSAGALDRLARDADALVAAAAIAALGKIATNEAARALAALSASGDQAHRLEALHASLQCAQEMALRGQLAQARAIYERLAAAGTPQHIRRGASLGLKQLAADNAGRIFDGTTFSGWEGNLKWFRIEDGAIVGGSLTKSIPNNEFLCTQKEYGDFELRLKVKLLGTGANAGIQIRSARIPDHHEVIGYQADMGAGWWGCLYDESRRRRVLARPDKKELAKVLKVEDWNDYVIRCSGKRVQLWINGYQTVDYTETDTGIADRGIIGVQIHSGKPSEAWYKDITIRELR